MTLNAICANVKEHQGTVMFMNQDDPSYITQKSTKQMHAHAT